MLEIVPHVDQVNCEKSGNNLIKTGEATDNVRRIIPNVGAVSRCV